MTRALLVLTVLVTLSVPAALAAPPAGKGKPESPGKSATAPGQAAEKNAAKKCQSMRKNDAADFASKYGTGPNALGRCVQAEKAQKAEERADMKAGAVKECREERERVGLQKFRETYSPPNHPTGANAFGKCVSSKVKEAEEEAEEQEARENAAKKCKRLRAEMGVDDFRKEYGTNPNKMNAFGKCVSKYAEETPES